MVNHLQALTKLKLYILLLLIGPVMSLQAQKYSGDSWEQVKANGKGTISVIYYHTPGIIFKGKDGKMKGVCAELLNDFKKYVQTKHGKSITLKYVHKETVWSKFLVDVKSSKGGVIGVANTTITAQRTREMTFSPPYLSNPMVLLTNKDVESISSVDQIPEKFKGFSAIMIDGSTHIQYMKAIKKMYYPEMNIKYALSGAEILDKMVTDKKIFSILDFSEYYDAIKRRLPIKKHSVKIGKTNERLGLVMPKGSDWGALWQEFLTPAYKRSSRYKQIISQNLGNQFTFLID